MVADYLWWWWRADSGERGLKAFAAKRRHLERRIKAGWPADHPEYIATTPPPLPSELGFFISRFAQSVGSDQFLSKKEWLMMHGIDDNDSILAICAGGDAYNTELNELKNKIKKEGE